MVQVVDLLQSNCLSIRDFLDAPGDFTLRMTCNSLLPRDKGKPFVQKKSGNFAFPLLK